MAVSFGDALKNAGIIPSEQEGYDKKNLNAEGQDQFDYYVS